jgi:DNA uptake protein ComE-like DNA-binding protein
MAALAIVSSEHEQQTPMPWTLSQRLALSLIVAALMALGAWRYVHNPVYVPEPLSGPGARADELLTRLDPNTAPWRTLAALPGLGDKRAQAIAAYRDAFQQTHPDDPAFRSPADLMKIKGIGPATTQNLEPYLTFPDSPPP